MATEGHPNGWKGVRMRYQKLRNIRLSGAFCPEVRVFRAFFLVQKVGGDMYDVRVLYFYIYIHVCCVVLQVFLLNNQYCFVNFLSIATFLDSFF